MEFFNSTETGYFCLSLYCFAVGHVIGLNSYVWRRLGRINENFEYTGEAAVNVWQNVWSCVGNPPVQTRIVNGVKKIVGHWQEECLVNELMTPFINSNANPLSKLTIGNIEDTGYEVNYGAADEYDGSDTTCCTPDNNNPPPNKPSLSESANNAAVVYGRNVLNESKLPSDQAEGNQEETGIVYVGDKLITILVEENGYLYDVHVTNE